MIKIVVSVSIATEENSIFKRLELMNALRSLSLRSSFGRRVVVIVVNNEHRKNDINLIIEVIAGAKSMGKWNWLNCLALAEECLWLSTITSIMLFSVSHRRRIKTYFSFRRASVMQLTLSIHYSFCFFHSITTWNAGNGFVDMNGWQWTIMEAANESSFFPHCFVHKSANSIRRLFTHEP